MEAKFCQSCGMPMTETAHFGTEHNGVKSNDYCGYCYKNGAFTSDVTMEQMVDICLEYLDEFNKDSEHKFTKEEARAGMLEFFPTLKRWNS